MPRYILVHSTASTNSYLSKMAMMLPSGTVIHTLNQTEGRGQRGNSWESEPGKNVLFSMLLKSPIVPVAKQFVISEAVAVAVVTALSGYVEGLKIKWPNDIYYKDKKLCGILIEHSIMGNGINYSILGVGINVNQELFVSDAPNPVSLAQIIGQDLNVDEVLHRVCEEIERRYSFDSYTNEDFAKLHREFLSLLYRNDGAFYPYTKADEKCFNAKIVDVEPSGLLVLEDEGGSVERYAFKEVQFVLKK